MKLTQFLEANMEQLLEDWENAALEIAPQLKAEDSPSVRDHARHALEFICQELVTSQTKNESASKALSKGKNPVSSAHAMDSVVQGLSLFQVVQEFGALRARVTSAWREEHRGLRSNDIDELARFNESIDQLVANSVSSYSALKEQEVRLVDTMLMASPDPAAIFDRDGEFLYINTAMAKLADAPARNILGKTPSELGLEFAVELHDEIATTVATGQTQRRELHHCASGQDYYYDCQLVPVFNDQNEVEAVVKTSRDVTERKQTDCQIWRNANFDSLTGIPNRQLFLDRLEQTLREAHRKSCSFALLFIDLDHFKHANDQLGHEAGDRLLAQVAERLTTKVRAMDTVARLGGDEFTLILKETGRDGAKEAAKVLLTSLEQAFDVDSHQVNISGSIGLTIFPDDGKDAGRLMHNADQAMYAAKEQGGQRVQIYESWMAQSESEHMRLSRELENALKKNQFEVYYQPVIDIRRGAIYGAEALLRWNHPDKGLLTPDAFLVVTEQSGMTDSISAFVLEQAVICSLRWRDRNDPAFPISVNASPASFVTRSLVDQWRARLSRLGLDESWITIELTPASLNHLRVYGFSSAKSLGLSGSRLRLSIDEVGIEPFSLLAVEELRMDRIKIDRELVKEAGQGGDADEILEAIIAMAHAINIKVVAVGVESSEQLQFLSEAGCDYAQGFLFSKPLRPDDFGALLARHDQNPL